jgi:trehalose-phosphatase
LAEVERLWLFLDYDGTLADFAPNPDVVSPAAEVVGVVNELVAHPRIRVAVVSGRRLDHVRALVPVAGVLLAGTYGVEMLTAEGELAPRLDFQDIRPALASLKPRWAKLLEGREGFYLEDKGWALALHGAKAGARDAEEVLAEARRIAGEVAPAGPFRVLGGHRFLEVGPKLAHKGQTVAHILDTHPWPGALPLYVGDDDKDEEAFAVIHARGGLAVAVGARLKESRADCRLDAPADTRRWLRRLPRLLGSGGDFHA